MHNFPLASSTLPLAIDSKEFAIFRRVCNNLPSFPVFSCENRRCTLELAVREVNIATVPGEIERIFEECHGLVFRTAYRITGNAADAEDVLQAVFLRLFRRDRSAEPLENHESYLRRAAINASLDTVRARQDTANACRSTSRRPGAGRPDGNYATASGVRSHPEPEVLRDLRAPVF